MGTFENLKSAIKDVIKTNGNNEITGELLQQTLLAIVNSLGKNATFAGIATPTTNPGSPDQNVIYLAVAPGNYANFNAIALLPGEIAIISNNNGFWEKHTLSPINYTPITYAELVNLKNGGGLFPGYYYRITDYETTTTQANTRAAGHLFDIVVLALSQNELSERAWAVHSERDVDGYFEKSNLAAWQIWYSLENNATRFAWANTKVDYTIYVPVSEHIRETLLSLPIVPASIPNTLIFKWWDNPRNGQDGYGLDYYKATNVQMKVDDELFVAFTCGTIPQSGVEFNETIFRTDGVELPGNCFYFNTAPIDGIIDTLPTVINENIGKGVIYRMIDEWNNDCPYDFKNIQFKRFAVTKYDRVSSLVVDNEENYYRYYYGALDFDGNRVISATYGEDFVWVYTFALKDLATEAWHDYTILNSIGLKTDESVNITCHSNIIKEYRNEYLGENGEKAIWLNNIVFLNCYTDISSPDYSEDYSRCNNNTFGNNCANNTFGNYCTSNTFGNNFANNSFGNECQNNSFGNECQNNSFGNYCIDSSFGNSCTNNTFGNYCTNNTFGNNCTSNTFGNDCTNNTFGNSCTNNTFGNSCNNNTFGNYCNSNTFSNDCDNNTFGNECKTNNFGNYCTNNSFGNSCQNNKLPAYVRYNTFGIGVAKLNLLPSESGNPLNYMQNYRITNGLQGASGGQTIQVERNRNYETTVGRNSNGVIKQFCVADMF